MQWCRGGHFLLTGDHLGVMKVWNPSVNCVNIVEGAHSEAIRDITFGPGDAKFATASDDGSVKVTSPKIKSNFN